MEKVLNYVAPVVEIVEVEVEKGFVGSPTDEIPGFDDTIPGEGF